MRCLIGFFGITRSLRRTAGSIRDGFYAPLRDAGIPTLRAGHFNLPETIANPRSGEFGVAPDRADAQLLDLDLCWVEPQTPADVAIEFEVGRSFPDGFGDGYRSLANLCHQLRSLERLWTLLQLLGGDPADPIVLLRPDLAYIDRFDPQRDLAPILEGRADLIVPDWQGWGGLNDRFAFCSRRGAEIYATRRRAFVEGCVALGGMHSELFLDFIARRHGLRVARTGLRAVRVRANGGVPANDAAMLGERIAEAASHAA